MTEGKRGRPKTGRTTKVIRVPLDLDAELAIKLYYDVLPVIRMYQDIADTSPNSVRSEKLIAFLNDIGRI
jgi:hypothetical protein